MPTTFASSRPQLRDDLGRELLAIAARLQVDDDLAEVRAAERRRGAAADGRDQPFDVRVPARMMFGDLVLVLDQLVVRRALRRFGRHRDLIGVLLGDEALRHEDEQHAGQHQHHDERRHRRRPVPQDDLQRAVVAAQQAVEALLGDLGRTPTSLPCLVRLLQEQAAQHRRQRHRDDAGDQDRDADRDRELAEQPAEHAAHEQHRDEHRGQRQRHRDDGEADLARADQRRGQRILAHLDVPVDVLQHHDRVVDDEADREDERHHRQVVEAVAEHVHHARTCR